MMLSFGVARELGYTVQELHERITLDELLGWSCYFSLVNKQQEEQIKKASRRRR